MPTWWFVRHGESLAQIQQWPGVDQETPLSPLGEQQACELAPKLAGLPIQRVLVSPYLRARETALRAMAQWGQAPQVSDPIAPQKGSGSSASLRSQTPFEIIHDLRERYAGEDFRARFFEPEVNRSLAIWDFRPPGGESVLDAALRGIRCLARIEDDRNTIIFAHGRILAGILTILDQLDPTAGVYPLENCTPAERDLPQGAWGEISRRLA